MFSRALQPSSALLAPLRRTRDPLASSSVARHFVLPSGNEFIIRPPPSVAPPTVPSSLTTASSHPFLASFSSPSSSSSPAPSSPPSPVDPASLPNSRRRTTTTLSEPRRVLTADEIAELQRMRTLPEGPTRGQLAHQFGVPANVVARFGYGKGPDARLVERVRRGERQLEQDAREANWGWKKSIAREERKRRRSMW
ncbi:hypothetical protein JCM11491_004863 [Sporobolomyces phaffii]